MTALSVSTSMISWSAETLSPGLTLIETIVASAIDSPSWGIVIGTCGIIIQLKSGALSRRSFSRSADAHSRYLDDMELACPWRLRGRARHRGDENLRRLRARSLPPSRHPTERLRRRKAAGRCAR